MRPAGPQLTVEVLSETLRGIGEGAQRPIVLKDVPLPFSCRACREILNADAFF